MAEIFNFIKKKQFNDLFDYIKNNPTINLNIQDKNYNYFISYLILYQQEEIIKYIFENRDIKIDILDTDNRPILYVPIKFNYTHILELILKQNNDSIGLDIMNLKDNNGYTSLHYSVIFNNIDAFKILINNDGDINISDNKGNNIFQIGVIYKRTNILLYLLEQEKDNFYNMIGSNGESILQSAINYENKELIKYILNDEQ